MSYNLHHSLQIPILLNQFPPDPTTYIGEYRMVGNFRGVLIFVIFVVDLAVTKFSHPRKLVIGESMMMGVTTNIVAAWPTFYSISKQQ